MRSCSRVLLVVLVVALSVMAWDVKNYSFEEPVNSNGTIPGWSMLWTNAKFVSVTDEAAFEGKFSLKINDTTPDNPHGLRSDFLPAKPGLTYVAGCEAMVNPVGAIYIEFWPADRQERLDAKWASVHGTGEKWQPLIVEARAPEGTAWVTILLYSHKANSGVAYFDSVWIDEF